MTEQKPQKSFLRKAFNLTARAAFFPFGETKASVSLIGGLGGLAFSILATPFAAKFFYPTAEEVVAQEGLNPKIVQELAPGQKTHVMEGWMSVFSFNPNLPIFQAAYAFLSPNASARHADSFSYSGTCTVRLDLQERFSPKEIVEKSLGNVNVRDDLPVTRDEWRLHILFHETRHCSNANHYDMTALEAEGDADFHAIQALSSNPEMPKFALFYRAATTPSFNSDHDVALYLDARLNGDPIPSTPAIKEANKIAGEFFEATKGKKALPALSPLAARCLELYIQAHDYFTAKPEIKETPKVKAPIPSA